MRATPSPRSLEELVDTVAVLSLAEAVALAQIEEELDGIAVPGLIVAPLVPYPVIAYRQRQEERLAVAGKPEPRAEIRAPADVGRLGRVVVVDQAEVVPVVVRVHAPIIETVPEDLGDTGGKRRGMRLGAVAGLLQQ